MDAVHPGGLGGTYGGNPVACAAALGRHRPPCASTTCRRAPARLGAPCAPGSTPCSRATPGIGDVRGRGAMQAIELVHPGTTRPDAARTGRAPACHRAGVVTLGAGTYGNVIRLLPPLVIPEPLLAEGLDVLADALAANPPT